MKKAFLSWNSRETTPITSNPSSLLPKLEDATIRSSKKEGNRWINIPNSPMSEGATGFNASHNSKNAHFNTPYSPYQQASSNKERSTRFPTLYSPNQQFATPFNTPNMEEGQGGTRFHAPYILNQQAATPNHRLNQEGVPQVHIPHTQQQGRATWFNPPNKSNQQSVTPFNTAYIQQQTATMFNKPYTQQYGWANRFHTPYCPNQHSAFPSTATPYTQTQQQGMATRWSTTQIANQQAATPFNRPNQEGDALFHTPDDSNQQKVLPATTHSDPKQQKTPHFKTHCDPQNGTPFKTAYSQHQARATRFRKFSSSDIPNQHASTPVNSPDQQGASRLSIPCRSNQTVAARFKPSYSPMQKRATSKPATSKGHYDPGGTWLPTHFANISPEDEPKIDGSKWSEMELTGNIRTIYPSLFEKMTHLTHLYIRNNSLTELPPAIGSLSNLVCLDSSNNELSSLPLEVGNLVRLKELVLRDNYIRELPCEMGRLFNLEVLDIVGNPLPKELFKLLEGVNGTFNLITLLMDALPFPNSGETQSGGPTNCPTSTDLKDLIIHKLLHNKTRIQEDYPMFKEMSHPGPPSNIGSPSNLSPPIRPWIKKADQITSQPSFAFTILSYNVLSDMYATRQKYVNCPTWALDWMHRRTLILTELRHYSPHIIALQEVETYQFYQFFLPKLQKDGYDGIFAAKSRINTVDGAKKKHVDGCAIFFHTSKFKLISEHVIEFKKLASANANDSTVMANRVMTKDNIGIAVLLEPKTEYWENGTPTENTTPLLVCTTHLHWNPKHCDVKVVQMIILMAELKRIIDEISTDPSKTLNDKVHLLLCGDFNSLPNSGVIEFLETSRISMNHPDFQEMSYNLQRTSSNTDLSTEYTHGFKLKSAYDSEVMPYTNNTHEFNGIIDYLFHSKSNMKSLGILGPIDPIWLQEHKITCFPHPVIPSDHLPLMMELEITAEHRTAAVSSAATEANCKSSGLDVMGNSTNIHKLRTRARSLSYVGSKIQDMVYEPKEYTGDVSKSLGPTKHSDFQDGGLKDLNSQKTNTVETINIKVDPAYPIPPYPDGSNSLGKTRTTARRALNSERDTTGLSIITKKKL